MSTARPATFTNADHHALERYLRKLLEAVRDGSVSPAAAVGELAHLFAAVDIGNYTEPLAHSAMADQMIASLARQP